MTNFLRPAPLVPRSRVQLIAPASPFDQPRFEAGTALLERRYEVTQGDALFARRGFLAGPDAARLRDLQAALRDPSVGAILPARGGYGATRLLPALDLGEIARGSKWLVGLSDITALHAVWARAGLCSIHGAMVCSLPDASPALQAAWFGLLEGDSPAPLTNLSCLAPGRAQGRLFGGNLTVLSALVGTPYLPPLEDVVLLLEDIGERPYRLDRMLTTMLQAGFFRGVRAVVLGQFTDCNAGADAVSAHDVLVERLSTLGVPVLANAPFGHIAENTPLLLGSHAQVDADAGVVSLRAP